MNIIETQVSIKSRLHWIMLDYAVKIEGKRKGGEADKGKTHIKSVRFAAHSFPRRVVVLQYRASACVKGEKMKNRTVLKQTW